MNCSLGSLFRTHWLSSFLILLLIAAGCAGKAATKPEAVEGEPTASASVIEEITVTEEEDAVVVVVKGNQPLTYSAIKHQVPLGVVLYFPNTLLEGVEESLSPESSLIENIVISQPEEQDGLSRIQINLTDDVPYQVNQEENQIYVQFVTSPAEQVMGEEAAAGAATETAEATGMEATVVPVGAEAAGELTWVNRINFLMMEQGKSRVIVRTSSPVQYETERPSPNRVLLKLYNVKIPTFEKRPLITTRFNSAVDRIVPVQTDKMGNTAIIAMELREAVPYRVEQQENVFFVDFEPSTVPPRPLPDVDMPQWQQVMTETEAALAPPPEIPVEEVVSTGTGEVYTGQRISLDFQDADIRNVFRILNEISGKNFIIGSDVQGRVTLKLDNVPWDQVLDLVTRMNRLGIDEEGNIIRIAPLATLEAEKKAEESARQAMEEVAPLVTEYIAINYSDAIAMKTHLDAIKTERGNVSLDERTNMIIMTDVNEAIGRARDVVKKLDIVTRQVLIEARIVEAKTNFSREIGIQWGFDQMTTRGADQLGGPYGFSGGVGGDSNYAVNLPPAAATSGIDFVFSRWPGSATSLTINASLKLAEAEGKLKIISSPKILTMDNKEATIKQGTSIPYQKEEDNTVTTSFVDAVLSLTVTPHVTMDNRISMKINATKDAPDFSQAVDGQPAIDKKEATTELLVNNGETIVIGGIITETKSVSESRVPGLGKIPVIGYLFKNTSRKVERTELLIFVTTTIVDIEQENI
ncbi:MAG: type IV pilus secretin PilQ [Deltaproteobacteria bacterium]|nr:type IV pilus secretin PilQ [Deltaproteobacteria bacterium]